MTPASAADTTLIDLGAEAIVARLRGWGPLRDLLGTYDDGELRLEEGTPAEIVDDPKSEHFPVFVLETVDADEFGRLSGEFRYQLDIYVWPFDDYGGSRPFGVSGVRDLDAVAKNVLRTGRSWRHEGVHFSSRDFDVVRDDKPPRGPYVRGRRGTIRAGGA